MFWVANFVTVAFLLGPRSLHRWWMAEVNTSTAMLTALALITVVFLAASALLMDGVYRLFRRTLEGDTDLPAIRLLGRASAALRRRQNARLLEELVAVRQQFGSAKVFAIVERRKIAAALEASQTNRRPAPTAAEVERFRAEFDMTMGNGDDRDAIEAARGAFERALVNVNGDKFTPQLERWNDRLARLVDTAASRAADIASRSTDVSAIAAAPSEYGEVLATVSRYASSRYGIDSIVFWSRLQPVIPPDYLAVVEGAKVRMDMLTSLTLLALLYATSWFFVLPYFAVAPWVLFDLLQRPCGGGTVLRGFCRSGAFVCRDCQIVVRFVSARAAEEAWFQGATVARQRERHLEQNLAFCALQGPRQLAIRTRRRCQNEGRLLGSIAGASADSLVATDRPFCPGAFASADSNSDSGARPAAPDDSGAGCASPILRPSAIHPRRRSRRRRNEDG
jgi:hypothetical protein